MRVCHSTNSKSDQLKSGKSKGKSFDRKQFTDENWRLRISFKKHWRKIIKVRIPEVKKFTVWECNLAAKKFM
jgi:hypothetical protein